MRKVLSLIILLTILVFLQAGMPAWAALNYRATLDESGMDIPWTPSVNTDLKEGGSGCKATFELFYESPVEAFVGAQPGVFSNDDENGVDIKAEAPFTVEQAGAYRLLLKIQCNSSGPYNTHRWDLTTVEEAGEEGMAPSWP